MNNEKRNKKKKRRVNVKIRMQKADDTLELVKVNFAVHPNLRG